MINKVLIRNLILIVSFLLVSIYISVYQMPTKRNIVKSGDYLKLGDLCFDTKGLSFENVLYEGAETLIHVGTTYKLQYILIKDIDTNISNYRKDYYDIDSRKEVKENEWCIYENGLQLTKEIWYINNGNLYGIVLNEYEKGTDIVEGIIESTHFLRDSIYNRGSIF